MSMSSLVRTCVLCGFALLGLSSNAAEVGVRLRFGLTDNETKTWDGSVSVKPGKVSLISGWRFEQTDHSTGVEGWVASTRPAAVNRTAAQKAKAKAAKAKGGGAAAKAKAKAG